MSRPEIQLPQVTPEQEEAIAARYLASLEPGFLPYAIFRPLGRLIVRPTVEVGFVKPSVENESGPRILLTQRPASDEDWAGQWHVPGSVMRPSDPIRHEHDYDAAVGRVLEEVGGDVHIIGNLTELETVCRRGLRGSEITVRMFAEAEGDPGEGAFFDAVDVLREPPASGLIDTHAAAIERIAAAYTAMRTDR